MITVYRVEDENCYGPYMGVISAGSFRAIDDSLWQKKYHPFPEDDGLPYPQEDHRSGFANLDQLWDWFGGYEWALAADGYGVVSLQAEPHEVEFGRHQVLFVEQSQPRTPVSWEEVSQGRA